MAEKKKTAKKTPKKTENKELLPFDELPTRIKRNRRNLYEYIRTGEF